MKVEPAENQHRCFKALGFKEKSCSKPSNHREETSETEQLPNFNFIESKELATHHNQKTYAYK